MQELFINTCYRPRFVCSTVPRIRGFIRSCFRLSAHTPRGPYLSAGAEPAACCGVTASIRAGLKTFGQLDGLLIKNIKGLLSIKTTRKSVLFMMGDDPCSLKLKIITNFILFWKGSCYILNMKTQNYQNHRKFYPPHHFIFLPLLLILEVYGIRKILNEADRRLIWILFSSVVFLVLYLAVMTRQHYALGLQNRMVRLEFRQRYFEIFSKRSDEVCEKLSFEQMAALRFAYDEEFKELLYKALNENLSGDAIKKSIKNWRPDHDRI